MQSRVSFGVDIGGSGIKGAVVDLASGSFVGERRRVETPRPSTPGALAAAVGEVVRDRDWEGALGCAFPGVVTSGVVRTAFNLDPSLVGVDVAGVLAAALGRQVLVMNDADAAGVAEVAFGAARGQPGLVVLTTLGTGIGSALVHDGVLVPNSELGHLKVDGRDAELGASAAAREREKLSWDAWAERLQRFYRELEDYLWPDLFVVGGGVSRKADRFLSLLELRTPIVPAELRNRAGIVGAALQAAKAALG